MNLEEAIKTAINYETEVRDVYKEALDTAKDKTGQRIFGVLMKEEQYHIDYLEKKLKAWIKNEKLTAGDLKTAIPAKEIIEEDVEKLQEKMSKRDYSDEILMLRKALDVEIKTSNFYQSMVDNLNEEGKDLFTPFLEIEKGHQAVVRAEIDYLEGAGFWYEFQESDLED